MQKLKKICTEANLFNIPFAIAAVATLVVSWFAIFDLAQTQMNASIVIAALFASMFDIAAIALAAKAFKNAKLGYSAIFETSCTYLLVAISAYLNVQHAIVANVDAILAVASAAPPVIFAVLLHVLLKDVLKDIQRVTGRVAPTLGLSAWIFYAKDSWNVLRNTAKAKIDFANAQLGVVHNEEVAIIDATEEVATPAIEVDAPVAQKEIAMQKPVAKTTQIAIDNLELPEWAAKLDHPVAMSTLAKEAVANGVDNANEFIAIATMLGIEVNHATAKSAFSRARSKEVTHG